jgi:hypothetical protein
LILHWLTTSPTQYPLLSRGAVPYLMQHHLLAMDSKIGM